MDKLKVLNKKEAGKIIDMIENQFGFGQLDYVFLKSLKNRIYIVNKDISELDLSKLRINSIGLYIAEILGNEIRLSIEGSQMIGPKSTKNMIELDFDEQIKWLKGEDLDKSEGEDCFKILKHENDFLGCGRQKQGKILNYIPKTRRLALKGDYFS